MFKEFGWFLRSSQESHPALWLGGILFTVVLGVAVGSYFHVTD